MAKNKKILDPPLALVPTYVITVTKVKATSRGDLTQTHIDKRGVVFFEVRGIQKLKSYEVLEMIHEILHERRG